MPNLVAQPDDYYGTHCPNPLCFSWETVDAVKATGTAFQTTITIGALADGQFFIMEGITYQIATTVTNPLRQIPPTADAFKNLIYTVFSQPDYLVTVGASDVTITAQRVGETLSVTFDLTGAPGLTEGGRVEGEDYQFYPGYEVRWELVDDASCVLATGAAEPVATYDLCTNTYTPVLSADLKGVFKKLQWRTVPPPELYGGGPALVNIFHHPDRLKTLQVRFRDSHFEQTAIPATAASSFFRGVFSTCPCESADYDPYFQFVGGGLRQFMLVGGEESLNICPGGLFQACMFLEAGNYSWLAGPYEVAFNIPDEGVYCFELTDLILDQNGAQFSFSVNSALGGGLPYSEALTIFSSADNSPNSGATTVPCPSGSSGSVESECCLFPLWFLNCLGSYEAMNANCEQAQGMEVAKEFVADCPSCQDSEFPSRRRRVNSSRYRRTKTLTTPSLSPEEENFEYVAQFLGSSSIYDVNGKEWEIVETSHVLQSKATGRWQVTFTIAEINSTEALVSPLRRF